MSTAMFGRVKRWLGIEGVKLELLFPEEVLASEGIVEGKIRFQSLQPQVVTQVSIALIERFSRGKGKEKLVDEYELGRVVLQKEIAIPAGQIIEVDFRLPFDYLLSEMDEMERKNVFFKGIVKAAKYLRRVKSEFRIEAEARVKGVALNPFDKKPIRLV